jgi:hypothetical protein
MKPPIIINDSAQIDVSGDLRVYDSIEAAEESLERDDARDDQLHAFDSEGRLLKIIADRGLRGGAHLEEAEASVGHRQTLLTILKDFLVKMGLLKTNVESLALEELIRASYDKSPNPY